MPWGDRKRRMDIRLMVANYCLLNLSKRSSISHSATNHTTFKEMCTMSHSLVQGIGGTYPKLM